MTQVIRLFDKPAQRCCHRNKSLTLRSALESLTAHAGHEGWSVNGCTDVWADKDLVVYLWRYAQAGTRGNLLSRPVFQHGEGRRVLTHLPGEVRRDCAHRVEHQVAA